MAGKAPESRPGQAGKPGSGRRWKRRLRSAEQIVEREGRKRKIALVVLGTGVSLAGVALLWVAAAYYRCESEDFRRELSNRLSERVGFEVHVGPIEMRGLSLNAPNISMRNGHGVVKYAEFRRLQAVVAPGSFFGGPVDVTSLQIAEGDVHFAAPGELAANGGRPAGPASGGRLAAMLGLSGDAGAWRVAGLHVDSLNLFWSGGKDRDSSLQGARLASAGLSSGESVRLTGGAFQWAGYPAVKLEYAQGVFEDGGFKLEVARLRREGAEASGQADTVEAAGSLRWMGGGEIEMEIALRDFAIEGLLNDWWKGRLGGRLSAQLHYSGALRGGGAGGARGSFRVDDGRLRDVALLDALADAAGETRLRSLKPGKEFSGEIAVDPEGIAASGLRIEDEGFIRVTGAVSLARGGAIDGELEVGLPEALLGRFEGGKPGFFGPSREGFCFAKLIAGGTIDYPTETLSAAVLSAVATGRAIAGKPADVAQPAKEDAPDTRPLTGRTHMERLEELFRALLD